MTAGRFYTNMRESLVYAALVAISIIGVVGFLLSGIKI